MKNLQFAKLVEPNNSVIEAKLNWAKEKRKSNEPTIPSTIGEEREINPFMRVEAKSVQLHTKTDDPISTMAALRKEKDHF